MSANRDKTQRTTFVYSNLYQLYKKTKEEAQNPGLTTSQVLKVDNLNEPTWAHGKVEIKNYKPAELLGKRIEKAQRAAVIAEPLKVAPAPAIPAQTALSSQNAALDSLKQNLQQLNDLHSRLKFMLQELEELVKE